MKKTSFLLIAVALFAVSCKDNAKQEDENLNSQTEEESMETKENEDMALFNGENFDGWKAYNAGEITQWKVEDNAVGLTPSEGRTGSENLITNEQYTNFELSLEWKIAEGGNSGIMWGVQEDEKFGEPYLTGPEIQVLDNEKHPDGQNGPIRQSGALYDMVEPSADVTKAVGEWDEMVLRINYEENKGSVSLNGTQVTEFPLHGQQWDSLVGNSKFKDWQDFGKHRTGHIALQDHGDKVWYRNIRIKEL